MGIVCRTEVGIGIDVVAILPFDFIVDIQPLAAAQLYRATLGNIQLRTRQQGHILIQSQRSAIHVQGNTVANRQHIVG